MSKPVKRRKYTKTCQQAMFERMQENRSKQVQQLFSQLEMDARRELLMKDAAQRERERNTYENVTRQTT